MLLSETELRAALEPLLDRLLVERLRYFQLQLEPRMRGLIEAALAAKPAEGGDTGLERVLNSRDRNQTFDAVFEASAGLVGPIRALLVTYGGETAVWRAQGLELPERFATSTQAAVLDERAAQTHSIRVGETSVGFLAWKAQGALDPGKLARLRVLLEVAGLRLLAQAWTGPQH